MFDQFIVRHFLQWGPLTVLALFNKMTIIQSKNIQFEED